MYSENIRHWMKKVEHYKTDGKICHDRKINHVHELED